MKKYRLFSIICLVAALLLSACSQDELAENSTALPEGEYPLQIGSVTLTAEVSEQPWTRVSESTDGMSSVWENGNVFYVKFEGSDDVGTYKITDAAAGTVEAVKPVYWRSASEEQTIIAWYAPQEEGTIDVSNQKDNLVYVLRAEQKATYNSGIPVSLQFSHQLSKVRVYLRGTAYEGNDTDVTFSYPVSYTISEGVLEQASGANGKIQMHKAENTNYYEALVFPGTIETNENIFEVTLNNTTTVNINLSAPLTLVAGSKHDVTLRLHKQGTKEIDLSKQSSSYEINTDGDYYFYGSGSNGIKLTGGNPNVYLGDAAINVGSGNAIDITNGSPTIHVQGNNTVSTNNGVGIFIAQGNTVTIEGNGTDDALTVEGRQGGAGIGGSAYTPCGDIIIDNITVTARSKRQTGGGTYAAGIGTSSSSVGKISISNAIIYAYAAGDYLNMGAAAIGSGTDDSGGTTIQREFDITISNSTIYASKGCSYASYIGAGGETVNPTGYTIISTAKITNSTIYNESGAEITQ